MAAFHYAYSQLDPSVKNPVATIYNGGACEVVCNNGLVNLCPFAVFEHCILTPYRESVATKQAAFLAENVTSSKSAEMNSTRANRYVEVAIENLLHEIATAPVGRRHITLRDKSKRIGHLLSAEWHTVDCGDIMQRLMQSVKQNGFIQAHGIGQARRTFESDLLLGAKQPASIPSLIRET